MWASRSGKSTTKIITKKHIVYSHHQTSNVTAQDIEILKEELEHFIQLSQAQAKQLDQYAELQKKSLEMIRRLLKKIELHNSNNSNTQIKIN